MARESLRRQEPAQTEDDDGSADERQVQRLISDIEPELKIKEHALDEALQQNPDLFYRVSKALALAISRRDGAKQNLAELDAEVDTKLRNEAAQNEEKITEAGLTAKKRAHRAVVRANETLLKLNSQVMQLQALKDSFQQRSYALGNLVDLHVAGYFSDASAGRARRDSSATATENYRRARREDRDRERE